MKSPSDVYKQHPDLPDVIMCEWTVDGKIELYALYCQKCEAVKKVRRTGALMVCHYCQSTMGVRMPDDYTQHMIEERSFQ